MKRCPECRRDYYDDSLLYCLDDGSELLEGPSAEEPPTLIISKEPVSSVTAKERSRKRKSSAIEDRVPKGPEAAKEPADVARAGEGARRAHVSMIWLVIGALGLFGAAALGWKIGRSTT